MLKTMFTVEVAYATATKQLILALQVPEGTTVAEAIALSNMAKHFPEEDFSKPAVGIFSQICALNKPLKAGDRVEIYRPLLCDPKQARRERAAR